jgi:hypothetical protein
MEVGRGLVYPCQTMLDDVQIDASSYVVVTPRFKAKTKCIPLCVPGSIFTHKATNSELNSITNVYYIES